VLTNGQIFRDNLSTTGALLRCAPGVNECHTMTSVFCSVRSELHELTPGHIRYAPVDGFPAVLLHVLNLKVLKGYELGFVCQLARLMVCKVAATIRGATVRLTQSADHLAAFWPTRVSHCRGR
jgi:hypothetical protein